MTGFPLSLYSPKEMLRPDNAVDGGGRCVADGTDGILLRLRLGIALVALAHTLIGGHKEGGISKRRTHTQREAK